MLRSVDVHPVTDDLELDVVIRTDQCDVIREADLSGGRGNHGNGCPANRLAAHLVRHRVIDTLLYAVSAQTADLIFNWKRKRVRQFAFQSKQEAQHFTGNDTVDRCRTLHTECCR